MPTDSGITGPPHTITGLDPETAYEVRVRAVNAAGTSAWTAWEQFTTIAGETLIPGAKFIAPTGSNTTGDGSEGSPWATLQHAHDQIAGGDVIYMRDGTYPVSTWTNITKSGTSSNPTRIYAYPGETPVIDATGMTSTGYYQGWVLVVSSANWVHIKGITVTEGPMGGIIFRGTSTNCTLELCTTHTNGRLSEWEGTGITLEDTTTDTLVLNCDSHHNYDIVGGGFNADGFRSTGGTGNIFRGCRAWRNSDDGYDCYNSPGALFEDCWAWDNGKDDADNPLGDGNGFKLGGGAASGDNTVRRCVSWGNPGDGFGENDATIGSTLHNNTAWNCGMNFSYWVLSNNVFRNNISYVSNVDLGTTGNSSHNTWDLAVTVTSADFQTLDYTGADGARQANGSLPTLSFLRLAAGSDLIDAGVDVGLPYNGTAPDLGAFETS